MYAGGHARMIEDLLGVLCVGCIIMYQDNPQTVDVLIHEVTVL